MDFAVPALLGVLVFVLVEAFKQVAPDRLLEFKGSTIAAALAIGVGAAFLVAESAWGSESVFGKKILSEINAGSVVIVGLLAGAFAVGIHKGLEAVKHIGENQPDA